MTNKLDKLVIPLLMQWDYGQKNRGESDSRILVDAFREVFQRVEPFWYDTYMDDLPRLQKELLSTVATAKPDLVFLFPYTNQFHTDTLDRLKEMTTSAVWFGDDCFRFYDHSQHLAPHFTKVITTDHFSIARYRAIGIEPILSEWAGPAPDTWIPPSPIGTTFRHKLSFVGGANEVRRWFINHLQKSGLQVACFGNGWSHGRVSLTEMADIMRNTRINLNISNSVSYDIRAVFGGMRHFARWLISKKKAGQVKARNFEIPLLGGFQLTDYVPGMERSLVIGEEVAVYTNVDECLQQIHYFLNDDEACYRMATKAYERVRREHTYAHRFRAIAEQIFGNDHVHVG